MTESIRASSSVSNAETNPRVGKVASRPTQQKLPRLSSGRRKDRLEREAEFPRVENDDEKSSPPKPNKATSRKRSNAKRPRGSGVISRNKVYDLAAFKWILGFTDSTMRSARKNGLTVHHRHKRGFVSGDEWIEYILSSPPKSDSTTTPGTSDL